MSSTNQPPVQNQPAGWFPQPDGTQRYWDGNRWTEHVAPGPTAAPPPPGATSVTAEPKKKSWFARHKVLTGLLVLLLIFIVVKAVGGGSSGTTPAPAGAASAGPSSAAASSAPVPAPAPAPAGLNTPVSDGQFQFTVTKVDCGHPSVGTSPVTKTAQGQFCLVSVSVKNTGDKAQYLDASSQKAFNAQGQQYSADGGAGIYLDKSNTFLNQINPGNSVDGTIVFDIPKDAKLASLELHDSAFSGGVKVSL